MDAPRTFGHNNSNFGSSLIVVDIAGQLEQKHSFGFSLVWPHLELSLMTIDAMYFLDTETAASFVRFDRVNYLRLSIILKNNIATSVLSN